MSEVRGTLRQDSAGNRVREMKAREVEVGDEIVGGWRPGPIVEAVIESDDGETLLFVYEWVDPNDHSQGTKHTSPWLRKDETILVWEKEEQASARHPHEPEISPVFDGEGRCLVCALAVAETFARQVAAEAEGLREAIDAALETTWVRDDDGGWGTDEDTLFADRLEALAALQPHWYTWGDQGWHTAGVAEEKARKLREFIDGDAHHEMSTAAGLLRMETRQRKSEMSPTRIGEIADRLSDACRRARAALGVCPGCGGCRMQGDKPCPECVEVTDA